MTNILLNYYNFHEEWAYSTLSRHLTEGMRCVVLPLAYRDSEVFDCESWNSLYGTAGEKFDIIVCPLRAYGITDIAFVNFFEPVHNVKHLVQSADILLFTGGLPEKIVERLAVLELTDTIKNFGGIVLGVSAGAMMQLDNYHITPDSDYDNYCATNTGLSLVSGFDLEVHFEDTFIQRQSIERALHDNGKPIYAMWHTGGLVVENGIVATLGRVELFCLSTKKQLES